MEIKRIITQEQALMGLRGFCGLINHFDPTLPDTDPVRCGAQIVYGEGGDWFIVYAPPIKPSYADRLPDKVFKVKVKKIFDPC